jgi:hypothetical protein
MNFSEHNLREVQKVILSLLSLGPTIWSKSNVSPEDMSQILLDLAHFNLPPRLKYSLAINHFRSTSNFKFPSQYVDGCNRSCQHPYFVNNQMVLIFFLVYVLFASIGPEKFVTKVRQVHGVGRPKSLLNIMLRCIISLL